MSADLQDMFATIADIQRRERARRIDRDAAAANNRARMKACMFGRVTMFRVEQKDAA